MKKERKMDNDQMFELLTQAREEILSLRRYNEILSAKVEMIDLFACVLHTQPAQRTQGMSEDVAWKLMKAMQELAPK